MIKLILSEKKNQELYRNMFNFLHYELSVYLDEFSKIDENGYFDYQTTDVYYNKEDVYPYVVYSDDVIAGFVVVSCGKYTAPNTDFCIQELLILPKFRATGFSGLVIKELFKIFSGNGVLLIVTKNLRAMKFWKKTLNEYCENIVVEKFDENQTIVHFKTKNVK